MEKVHKGGFLSFRAQELHTLTITHWLLIFTLSTSSSAGHLKLLRSPSLSRVLLHLPLLLWHEQIHQQRCKLQ